MRLLILLGCLCSLSFSGPRPEDLKSPDSLVTALYEVISGPAGAERDWDRFLNLFHPDARMTGIFHTPDRQVIASRSPEEFAKASAVAVKEQGFFEKEKKRRTRRFGDILEVWSHYESRHSPAEKPFETGVNSIQMIKTEKGWQIIYLLWQGRR